MPSVWPLPTSRARLTAAQIRSPTPTSLRDAVIQDLQRTDFLHHWTTERQPGHARLADAPLPSASPPLQSPQSGRRTPGHAREPVGPPARFRCTFPSRTLQLRRAVIRESRRLVCQTRELLLCRVHFRRRLAGLKAF